MLTIIVLAVCAQCYRATLTTVLGSLERAGHQQADSEVGYSFTLQNMQLRHGGATAL